MTATPSRRSISEMVDLLDSEKQIELGMKEFSSTATSGGANDLYLTSDTGKPSFAVAYAHFVPFKTESGWWTHLSVQVSWTSGSYSSETVNVNGISFLSGVTQEIAGIMGGNPINAHKNSASVATNQLKVTYAASISSMSIARWSGTVKLDSKPLWAV